MTITGPDQHNLLLRLTGALNSLDLNVVSASISSSDDGTVHDVFRIHDSQERKARSPGPEPPSQNPKVYKKPWFLNPESLTPREGGVRLHLQQR